MLAINKSLHLARWNKTLDLLTQKTTKSNEQNVFKVWLFHPFIFFYFNWILCVINIRWTFLLSLKTSVLYQSNTRNQRTNTKLKNFTGTWSLLVTWSNHVRTKPIWVQESFTGQNLAGVIIGVFTFHTFIFNPFSLKQRNKVTLI